MALEDIDPTEPLYGDLAKVLEAAQRSTNIVRQWLAFSRQQPISPQVLDLNAAISGILKILQPLIGEDIDLGWTPQANLQRIKMDPSQIDQILVNLCVNAKDAINGVGRITIETGMVTFDEEYCANHAGFSATDNYGLPSEWDLLLWDEVAPQRIVTLRTILYHGLDLNTGTIFYGKDDLSVLAINYENFSSVYHISLDCPDSTGWSVMVAPVPEPATMILFGAGLVGLIGTRLKRKK